MSQSKFLAEDTDIDQVVSGKKAAWDHFVEKFSGLLFGVTIRTMRARTASMDQEDARDVVQDIFLRLVKDDFKLLRTYDPERASLSTWLTVVARSMAIDYLRRPERSRETVELDDTMATDGDAPFGGRLELPQGILSEREAQILRLLFDEDMDVAEVATFLRVQAQTVRSLKHQALTKLREHYGALRPA